MTKQVKWTLDQSHSEITFKVKHLMIAHVKGAFKTFDASIYTTGKDFKTAEIDLWLDASSISTENTKRDEHLKSADFFDVQKHRQITFVSSTIGEEDQDGNRELWGELTIKGITKNIKLNVHFGGIINDPWGNERAGFTITGKVNRSEWDLKWNSAIESGGLMVGDEVIISSEVELTNTGQVDLTMELESSDSENVIL